MSQSQLGMYAGKGVEKFYHGGTEDSQRISDLILKGHAFRRARNRSSFP